MPASSQVSLVGGEMSVRNRVLAFACAPPGRPGVGVQFSPLSTWKCSRNGSSALSVGVSIFPNDGQDVHTLLRHADMAMYQAKASGRRCYRVFSSAMERAAAEKLELEAAMRRALEHGEFVVHYQPRVWVGTGRIEGVEALVVGGRAGPRPVEDPAGAHQLRELLAVVARRRAEQHDRAGDDRGREGSGARTRRVRGVGAGQPHRVIGARGAARAPR